MKPAYLILHTGLGDQFVMYGALLHLAEKRGAATVLCRSPQEKTVRSLYAEAPQVTVDCTTYWSKPWILDHAGRLGGEYDVMLPGTLMDNWNDFAPLPFDARFYAQVGVPFGQKWRKLPRGLSSEAKSLADKLDPCVPFSLVHDDPGRRMTIDKSKILQPAVYVKDLTGNMMDWTLLAQFATEIHCIDSSFLSLVELMAIDGLRAKKYFHVHLRRTQSGAPTYTAPILLSDWEIVGSP